MEDPKSFIELRSYKISLQL